MQLNCLHDPWMSPQGSPKSLIISNFPSKMEHRIGLNDEFSVNLLQCMAVEEEEANPPLNASDPGLLLIGQFRFATCGNRFLPRIPASCGGRAMLRNRRLFLASDMPGFALSRDRGTVLRLAFGIAGLGLTFAAGRPVGKSVEDGSGDL